MKLCWWTVMPTSYQTAIVTALRDAGVDVEVCYLRRHLGTLRQRIGWRERPFQPWEHSVQDISEAKRVVPDFAGRIQSVPSFANLTSWKVILWCVFGRHPWIVVSEGTRGRWMTRPLFRAYCWFIDRFALHAFPIGGCRACRRFVEAGVRPEKVTPFGYATARPSEDPSARSTEGEGTTFVFAGEFCARKATDVLAEAWRRLHAEYPSARILLAGGGELEGLVRDLDGAEFLGAVPPEKIYDVIRRGDVMLLPSRYDAWGVALAEGASAGLAMIGSDRTGSGDVLIEDGVNGFTVKAGDVDDLVRVMRFYAADRTLARRHGRAAKESAVRTSGESLASKLMGVLSRTLVVMILALAGCVGVRCDLSVPQSWQELDDGPIAVSTAEATLPIVTDDTPDDRWAAMFLAETIEETCGRRPDVIVVSKGQRHSLTNALFVGRVETGKEDEERGEGFRVLAKDGCVRFLGRADYAVFDWCERALGMRYYCEGGKCVERREEIVVPAVDYSDAPVFARRVLWGGCGGDWARVSKSGSSHRGGVNVHAPVKWIEDEDLKVTHPEIFENGETPMLCYGNPATLSYYKERIDRHIMGLEDSGGIVDTNRQVVTVCQWDAPLACPCRYCRDDPSSIIWGRFLRKLDAWLLTAHPDYMISFLPYLNTCAIPREFLNATNLLRVSEAEVCTMPGLALLKNKACKAREEKLLRGWQAATGRKVINWHYGCWPQDRTSAPYVFGETIRRHYQDMRDVTDGSFVCGGARDARMALSMYVWLRVLWNPETDVGAIYDEFARRMFGAASGPMRELIALQETCWNRQWDDNGCSFHNIFEVSFPQADVMRLKALLRQAFEQVREAQDILGAQRVRWYAAAMREFFAESEEFAKTPGSASESERLIRSGETNEMVTARSALSPRPWARTFVSFRLRSLSELLLTIRCEDPAAERMDFTRHVRDFVRDDDCVVIVLEDEGSVRTEKIYKDDPRVSHDATGWTVETPVRISLEALRRGWVRGNVCRWRVGDRRLPKEERVAGSRCEHSRLNTRYTNSDEDPAAFVRFGIIDWR